MAILGIPNELLLKIAEYLSTRKLGPRDLEGRPCMSVLLGSWIVLSRPSPLARATARPNKMPSLAYQIWFIR